MRILVIDDEAGVRKSVRSTCEAEGHSVDEMDSGTGVVARLEQTHPDLVLLDVGLPQSSGFDVCKAIRGAGHSMPVLILSARNEEIDVVLGFEMGADDYIQKPFRPRELLARIAAHARRRTPAEPSDGASVLAFRGLTIQLNERRVLREGSDVGLTHTEFDLLAFLAQQAGSVVSRERILAGVWGYSHRIETRVIDVHVRNLRRKIEADPSQPRFILSVPGVGYRFAGARAEASV